MIPPLEDLQYSPATRDSLIKNPVWRNLSDGVSVASARSGGIQMSAVDPASVVRLPRSAAGWICQDEAQKRLLCWNYI
ncbi:hypothetical protein Q8A67_015085 [Cirrhinus molitorella]|nr:hypothetical protein Q8A67_015085 [Cirrhinus molitorella]